LSRFGGRVSGYSGRPHGAWKPLRGQNNFQGLIQVVADVERQFTRKGVVIPAGICRSAVMVPDECGGARQEAEQAAAASR